MKVLGKKIVMMLLRHSSECVSFLFPSLFEQDISSGALSVLQPVDCSTKEREIEVSHDRTHKYHHASGSDFCTIFLRCVLFYRDIDNSEAYSTSGIIYGQPARHRDYKRKPFEVLGAAYSVFLSPQSYSSVSGQHKHLFRSRVHIRHFTGLKKPNSCISGVINLYDEMHLCLCCSMSFWFV